MRGLGCHLWQETCRASECGGWGDGFHVGRNCIQSALGPGARKCDTLTGRVEKHGFWGRRRWSSLSSCDCRWLWMERVCGRWRCFDFSGISQALVAMRIRPSWCLEGCERSLLALDASVAGNVLQERRGWGRVGSLVGARHTQSACRSQALGPFARSPVGCMGDCGTAAAELLAERSVRHFHWQEGRRRGWGHWEAWAGCRAAYNGPGSARRGTSACWAESARRGQRGGWCGSQRCSGHPIDSVRLFFVF